MASPALLLGSWWASAKPLSIEKERKDFLQANVGPGMEETHFALVIAMERCEQGLHLDNSLPGSLRAMKSTGDGSHAHLAHPDLSAGSAMCIGVFLPYHPEIPQAAEM